MYPENKYSNNKIVNVHRILTAAIMFILIICITLVIGIMLDALDFLPLIVFLLSTTAIFFAVFLIMAYGADLMLLAMLFMGVFGLISSWRNVAPV